MSQLVDAGSRPAQRVPGHAVTRPPAQELNSLGLSSFRGFAKYALELVVIWATYFILAKIGSLLASIDASAVPIWPPTGFALAVILLRGVRVWPAIFAAVLAANATTDVANMAFATSISTSLGDCGGQYSGSRHRWSYDQYVVRWPQNLGYADRHREIRPNCDRAERDH